MRAAAAVAQAADQPVGVRIGFDTVPALATMREAQFSVLGSNDRDELYFAVVGAFPNGQRLAHRLPASNDRDDDVERGTRQDGRDVRLRLDEGSVTPIKVGEVKIIQRAAVRELDYWCGGSFERGEPGLFKRN